MKGANTFTVQTGVLGETLADQHRDTTFDEFPDGPGISVQITTGEALVGTVKKGVVTLLYHYVGDLRPLFPGRIYASWVVGACVKEKDGTVWSRGKGGEESVTSETDCLGIIILVGERFDPDISEDTEMVCYKITHQIYFTLHQANSNIPHVGSER